MAKLITGCDDPVNYTRGNHSDLSLAEVPSMPVWFSRGQVRRTVISTGCQRCGGIGQDECLKQVVPQLLRYPAVFRLTRRRRSTVWEWCQTGHHTNRLGLAYGGHLPICIERDVPSGAVGE
jgi:hypothetical protein